MILLCMIDGYYDDHSSLFRLGNIGLGYVARITTYIVIQTSSNLKSHRDACMLPNTHIHALTRMNRSSPAVLVARSFRKYSSAKGKQIGKQALSYPSMHMRWTCKESSIYSVVQALRERKDWPAVKILDRHQSSLARIDDSRRGVHASQVGNTKKIPRAHHPNECDALRLAAAKALPFSTMARARAICLAFAKLLHYGG